MAVFDCANGPTSAVEGVLPGLRNAESGPIDVGPVPLDFGPYRAPHNVQRQAASTRPRTPDRRGTRPAGRVSATFCCYISDPTTGQRAISRKLRHMFGGTAPWRSQR